MILITYPKQITLITYSLRSLREIQKGKVHLRPFLDFKKTNSDFDFNATLEKHFTLSRSVPFDNSYKRNIPSKFIYYCYKTNS